MPAGDRELAELFAGTAASLLALWDAGSFFPRLVEPNGLKEPVRCKFCEVAEGCLRGDSGARRRLFEWTDAQKAGQEKSGAGGELASPRAEASSAPTQSSTGAEASAAFAALLRVWRLAAAAEEG
jgi:hypothetical protein